MMRKPTILVTGGAGYIGSHTCKALSESGFYPVSYDNLSRGNEQACKWGPLEIGSLDDGPRLAQVINQYKPVAVIHFAAYAYVGESVLRPDLYYNNNVVGTLSLLEAMKEADINKIVFSSTCATYGIPAASPIPETCDQKPINPYGRSKLTIEQILSDYEHALGLKPTCLRYFNAAGADPDLEIGETHDPEPHVIPRLLLTAAGQQSVFKIFGDDYLTPDGTCIRDYVHVCDIADVHVIALKRLLDGENPVTLNVGTGHGISVNELIENARRISDRSINIQYAPRRDGDPAILIADTSLIRETFDWSPRCSDLDTIISTAWKWQQKT